jgi:hypothetical protein
MAASMVIGDLKEEEMMPGKKHLRCVSAKAQREYEHIKASAQQSGRYGPEET